MSTLLTVPQAHLLCQTMYALEDTPIQLASWAVTAPGFEFYRRDILTSPGAPLGGVLGVVEFGPQWQQGRRPGLGLGVWETSDPYVYRVHLRPAPDSADALAVSVSVSLRAGESPEPVLDMQVVHAPLADTRQLHPTAGRDTAKAVLQSMRAHAARLASTERELGPWPVGTRVRHAGQEWARNVLGGTAVVTAVDGPDHRGRYEYTVRACREFSRRPGPDNPMDRETQWPGWAVIGFSAPEDWKAAQ